MSGKPLLGALDDSRRLTPHPCRNFDLVERNHRITPEKNAYVHGRTDSVPAAHYDTAVQAACLKLTELPLAQAPQPVPL